MTKEEFRSQYKKLHPDATDSECDKLYDEALKLVENVQKVYNDVKGGKTDNKTMPPNGNPDTPNIKDFVKDWDFEKIISVLAASTLSRYLYMYLMKLAIRKATGRKVTFKQVYFGTMAMRNAVRLATEAFIGMSDSEKNLLSKLREATKGTLG
jgi:hypothetical protein